MIAKFYILLVCAAIACGQNAAESDETIGDNGNIRIIAKLLNDCSRKEDVTVCFKVKAVNFLGRLLRSPNSLPITDSIALARDSSAPSDESNQTEVFTSEHDIEASLPRSLDKKNEKLDEIMWTMFKNLINTRTLQYIPDDENFEGRKKGGFKGGKKNGGLMMMATMMMGMMMKLALGKIALLAGKALIVGKIALVLAVVLALKKLSSGGGESHPQVVYATAEHGSGGSGGSGGWQRRFSDAQTLAYGSHDEFN